MISLKAGSVASEIVETMNNEAKKLAAAAARAKSVVDGDQLAREMTPALMAVTATSVPSAKMKMNPMLSEDFEVDTDSAMLQEAKPQTSTGTLDGSQNHEEQPAANMDRSAVDVVASSDDMSNEDGKYSLEDLQTGCPEGVNPKAKEIFLREADYVKAFGINRDQFQKLAGWKKTQLRKKAKIF
eukprot:SAG31_NODE_5636_length_2411_cov_2.188149_2_plen_184_part_00